jgi:hypothetical protein
MTTFAMVPDKSAPTEWGMPVYQLSAREAMERDLEFEHKV